MTTKNLFTFTQVKKCIIINCNKFAIVKFCKANVELQNTKFISNKTFQVCYIVVILRHIIFNIKNLILAYDHILIYSRLQTLNN